VVADLFQPGEGGEDQPFSFHAFRVFDPVFHLVEDGLVEGNLLPGEVAVFPGLYFFGRSVMTDLSVLRRLRMNGAVIFLSLEAASSFFHTWMGLWKLVLKYE